MPEGSLLSEIPGYFVGRPQCELIEAAYVPDRHLHKVVECAFVRQGELTVRVDDHVFRLHKGEFLLIPGNVLHEYQRKGIDDHVVKLKFMQEWMMPPFFADDEKEAFQALFGYAFRTAPDPAVTALIDSMLAMSGASKYEDYVLFAKISELIALFLSRPAIIIEKIKANLQHPRYLEPMLAYIHDNSHLRLTLPMLARHIGITESYCSKYIKQHTGLSFVEYLNAVRINNAQRMLIYSDMSISETMEKSGFSSVQTFNRVFKQQTGRTPLEYRKCKRRDAENAAFARRCD